MAASPLRRLGLLALAVAAALAILDAQERTGSTAAEVPRQTSRAAVAGRHASPTAPVVFDLSRLDRIAQRTRSEQEPKDLFAVEEPATARKPEPIEPPPPPPPPQAPEIPFRYLGSQDAAGSRSLFLEQQQETHIVKVGDTIGNAWRLDEVNQRSAVFTYVPLGQRRMLSLGVPG